jgi:hypothetical protein
VSWLPDHTRRLAERMLGAYCQRICPPEFREQVVLGFRIGERGATLHEVRRICGVPGTARIVDVAQLRYDARRGAWRLYYRDPDAPPDESAAPWRRYPRAPDRSLAALVRELDADPWGLFWPRINGASLRWCSSRGRCAGCTERYLSVLGGAEPAGPAAVTVPLTQSRGAG